MAFLVRKIDKGKWMQNDILSGADVSADAITICMKTSSNKLSAWEIETLADVDKAVVAIVASGDYLESIDVIVMDRAYLDKQGIEVIQEDEGRLTEQLRKTHYNIINLTYPKLGIVAQYTVDILKAAEDKRYRSMKLKEILMAAVDKNLLNLADLKESISRKLS